MGHNMFIAVQALCHVCWYLDLYCVYLPLVIDSCWRLVSSIRWKAPGIQDVWFSVLLFLCWSIHCISQVAQWLRVCLSMQEVQKTQVQSLGQEDPLEKEVAAHSTILAWKIPWTEEPGGLQSMGLQRIGHDWEQTHTGKWTNSVLTTFWDWFH